MKTFKHWRKQELADTFGLRQKQQCDDLDDWLNSDEDISENTERELVHLQQELRERVYDWNEQELIVEFIALLLHQVRYKSDVYKTFANRKLKAEIDGHLVSGEVDWMLANGEYEPKAPYFCLHEYKKDKGADSDPLGQLIIAMAAAQAMNENTNIIYGAYVTGRYWYFLTLKNNQYCVSHSYDATRDDDIFTIFKILKKLKGIIEEMAAAV